MRYKDARGVLPFVGASFLCNSFRCSISHGTNEALLTTAEVRGYSRDNYERTWEKVPILIQLERDISTRYEE